MFLVFGATGKVGRNVVAGLAAAGVPVRAFTRDPSAVPVDDFGGAVEAFKGDMSDAASVGAALDGVSGVYLSTSPDALELELGVADALARSAVGRVVKLSTVAANTPVTDAYGGAHAASEEAVMKSGAEWTMLRPAGFMTNVLQWRGSIAAQGKVFQPYGQVGRAVIDPLDVAAVAVACLLTPGHHEKAYQLTGPESLTTAQQTAKLAAVLGRALEFVEVDPEQARAGMERAGMPADLVAGLLASMADPSTLRGGTPTKDVAEVTGRPPASFDDWLVRNRGEFPA